MARPSTNLLSRSHIAREALEMYRQQGSQAFSLRKLAEQLGVKSPSLYNHIVSQEDLVDAMHDVIQEEVDTAMLEGDDWRAAITAHVHSYRAAYARHPEVALMIARRPIQASGLDWYDLQLRSFQRFGLAPAEALKLSAAVDYLVFGSMALPYVEGFGADSEYAEDYPYVANALRAVDRAETNEEGFAWALDRLLDGIAPVLDAKQRRRAARARTRPAPAAQE